MDMQCVQSGPLCCWAWCVGISWLRALWVASIIQSLNTRAEPRKQLLVMGWCMERESNKPQKSQEVQVQKLEHTSESRWLICCLFSLQQWEAYLSWTNQTSNNWKEKKMTSSHKKKKIVYISYSFRSEPCWACLLILSHPITSTSTLIKLNPSKCPLEFTHRSYTCWNLLLMSPPHSHAKHG